MGPPLAGWSFSAAGQYEAGTPGRQSPWLLLLAVALPPLFMILLLGDAVTTADSAGYEQLNIVAPREEVDEEAHSQ